MSKNLYAVFGFNMGSYNDPSLPCGMSYNEPSFEFIIAETSAQAKYRAMEKFDEEYTSLRVILLKKNLSDEEAAEIKNDSFDSYVVSNLLKVGSKLEKKFSDAYTRFWNKNKKYIFSLEYGRNIN